MRRFLTPLVVACVLSGCLPERQPAIDQATVLSNNTSVRLDATSSSRTLFMLDQGDRVEILDKRDSWYLIRDVEQIEGWMDESTLIRDQTRASLDAAVDAARDLPVQNTGQTSDEVNLRLDPGRDSAIIRRLRRGVRFDVLGRDTTPRPASDATDIWYQVRTGPEEVGWLFSQLMDLDTPQPLTPFTEGRTYTAALLLKQEQDPDFGTVDWYVVAERRDDTPPEFAYDGIRVFIWNLAEQRYDTTLRRRNLAGLYPLELTGTPREPGFRYHVAGTDGEPMPVEWVMRGTLPRPVP
jgi:uncharacterized protein YgiM (DUF1202 family)